MFEIETAGPCVIRKLKCVCVCVCVWVCVRVWVCRGEGGGGWGIAPLVTLSGYARVTKCKYRISSRGVLIWNNFLSHYEKQLNPPLFSNLKQN